MSLLFRLVVGRVEIVDAALEAGLHDCEVLIRESDVDAYFGLVTAEEFAELLYTVGIDGVGDDFRYFGAFFGEGVGDTLSQGVAFLFTARGDDYL